MYQVGANRQYRNKISLMINGYAPLGHLLFLSWELVNVACEFLKQYHQKPEEDFSGDPVVNNLPANAGDMGLIPGLERFHMLRANKPRCHNY